MKTPVEWKGGSLLLLASWSTNPRELSICCTSVSNGTMSNLWFALSLGHWKQSRTGRSSSKRNILPNFPFGWLTFNLFRSHVNKQRTGVKVTGKISNSIEIGNSFFLEKDNIPYFETVSEGDSNVDNAFEIVARNALAREKYNAATLDFRQSIRITPETEPKRSKKCSC